MIKLLCLTGPGIYNIYADLFLRRLFYCVDCLHVTQFDTEGGGVAHSHRSRLSLGEDGLVQLT